MKKTIITASMLASILIGYVSCSDKFLDKTNPNQLTTPTFWKTQEDAIRGNYACYAGLQEEGTWKRWMDIALESRGDLVYSKSPWAEFANYSKFVLPNYNWVLQEEIWRDHYLAIYRTNQVLTYVPAIQMDETLKKQLLAQTKFIRAFLYFELVSLWGNVPLVLTPSEPSDKPDYTTEAQVWEQIIKDLQEAQPDLLDRYPESELGRATKGAATALLGKAYMQLHRWAEAEAEFQKVINPSAGYDLMPDYRDNFKHTTENNKESIWEIQFSSDFSGFAWDKDVPNTSEGSRRAIYFAPRSASGNADAQPTQWYIDQFFLEPDKNGNVDPRLDASIIYNRAPTASDSNRVYGTPYIKIFDANSNEAFSRKYLNDYWRDKEDEHSPINQRIIRFADVLLLYAEALTMQGKEAQAYPHIDRVRVRAGLNPLSVVKPGLSQSDMLKQIMHERVLELGGESQRWYDLKRWELLTSSEGVAELKKHDAEFNAFTPGKNELLPIPTREIDLNPKLKQNPNY